jgi:hypothetical protein
MTRTMLDGMSVPGLYGRTLLLPAKQRPARFSPLTNAISVSIANK